MKPWIIIDKIQNHLDIVFDKLWLLPVSDKRVVQLHSCSTTTGGQMAKQDKFTVLRAWVAEAQTVMGLDHWEITIVEAASDVDAWRASVGLSNSATNRRSIPQRSHRVHSTHNMRLLDCKNRILHHRLWR